MSYLPGSMEDLVSMVKMTATTGAVALTTLGGLLYFGQGFLIYPANQPPGSRKEVWKPDKFGIEHFEELILEAPDGVKLHSYLMLQDDPTTAIKEGAVLSGEDRPTIIFFHANAGNMGHRLPIAKQFYVGMKCNVLMLSYRGYGLSEGSPSEAGLRMDAQTALNYVFDHSVLKKTSVILYGQSLGGAVCVDMAFRNQDRIHGMILENTFLSLPKLVPSVLPYASPFVSFLSSKWESEKLISHIKTSSLPVLFLSGRSDDLIPPEHMDQLFELCGNKADEDGFSRKFIEKFPDGTHNDTCIQPEYFRKIALFIRDQISARPDKQKIPGYKVAAVNAKSDGAEALSRVIGKKAEL